MTVPGLFGGRLDAVVIGSQHLAEVAKPAKRTRIVLI